MYIFEAPVTCKGTASAMLDVLCMFSIAGPRLIAALITTPGLVLCEGPFAYCKAHGHIQTVEVSVQACRPGLLAQRSCLCV
ncbi:unnamed protein product [Gadus morhua 'NCC']